jgi:hypothetical protein
MQQIDWSPKAPDLKTARAKGIIEQQNTMAPKPIDNRACATYPTEIEREVAKMIKIMRALTGIDISEKNGYITYSKGSVADVRKLFPKANIPEPPPIQLRLF